MGSTCCPVQLRLLNSHFKFISVGLLLFAFGPRVLRGQSPVRTRPAVPSAPGYVEGHVLCRDGGFPGRDAKVHLIPLSKFFQDSADKNARVPEDSVTDLEGNYVVPSVSPGTYIVNVEKEGYISYIPYFLGGLERYSRDQQKAFLGILPQVTVANGEASRADVTLHRGGAIMGRVNFDDGGPLSKGEITATLVSAHIGALDMNAERPYIDKYQFELTTTTDDRGFYRLAGLLPGTYRIDAEVREGLSPNGPEESRVGRIWVYAPDALSESDARLMVLGEGEEISDADITIPMSRLHAIGGLITQQGAPLAGAHVSAHRKGDKAARFAYNAISASDGTYRIDLLPPGTYNIKVEYLQKSLVRPVKKETTVQSMDGDVADANVDLPLQPEVK